MGCDFFYWGSLPQHDLQEKVVKFLHSSFYSDGIIINPNSELIYDTCLVNEKKSLSYPLNYYGIIPSKDKWLFGRGQFIFDRTAGGKLVRFLNLPQSWVVSSSQDKNGDDEDAVELVAPRAMRKYKKMRTRIGDQCSLAPLARLEMPFLRSRVNRCTLLQEKIPGQPEEHGYFQSRG